MLKEHQQSSDLVPEYNIVGLIYCSTGNWEKGLENLIKAAQLSQQTAEHLYVALSFENCLKSNSGNFSFAEAAL